MRSSKMSRRNCVSVFVHSWATALLPLSPQPDQARRKHNARTVRYKEAEALRGAPDSEAVRQATSNVLLSIMGLGGESAKGLLTLAMKELIEAGYDQEESRASILRLLADRDELAGNWKRRTRQKLARVVMAKLQAMNE